MQNSFSFEDTGSGIHRLSAFVIPAWVVTVMTASLVLQHPVFLAGVFLSSIPLAVAARVLRRWAHSMKYMGLMCVAIIIINVIVSNQGAHVLWQSAVHLPLFGTPRVTVEALAFGAAMAVRLSCIISVFTLLNLCVHPDELMRAAIKLRLPYRSVLITSLSTRYIPVLMEDARTISDVQRSRGLDFSRGSLVERIRNRGALILPLLSNSLDRAAQVAEAMESRAYGADVKRTFYRDAQLALRDYLALLLVGCGMVLTIVMGISGVGSYQYYPALGELSLGAQDVGLLLLLVVLLSSVSLAGVIPRGGSLD
ncbi:MAG: energy-coupling factor transporter transmembrane protein EcfT [Dehalococcoidia bacterium]|nr:energy-coupling factor transporter transmembrane protein EcfT [Dehalococcoidia bacterium]